METALLLLAMNTLPICPGATAYYSNECDALSVGTTVVVDPGMNHLSCSDGYTLVLGSDTITQSADYYCAKDLVPARRD